MTFGKTSSTLRLALGATALTLIGTAAQADFVINDDLIVDGSACIGFDCVNGESFGFDTLRLKENNTRIKFDDTSSSASFPRNKWELTANETSNGGAEKFSITDVTNGKVPFTITGNAPSNSLYVNASGRIGFGTSTPVVELHVKDGDTPTLRLEQDGSSGFTAQTWDVAGNEANFFVRDTTNGSRLVFRLKPGAPDASIYVDSDGDVGMGAGTNPGAALHVSRNTGAAATLLRLNNNNRPIFEVDNTSVASSQGQWRLSSANNGDFEINNSGVSGAIPVEFDLDMNGNLTLSGTVTAPSSRAFKSGITTVDGREVLAKLDAMPIVTWHYKNQPAENRHMGPVAEDFYAAFGLGEDEQFIALNDLSGVALAAIQALHQEVQARDIEIAALADQIALLKGLVAGSQAD